VPIVDLRLPIGFYHYSQSAFGNWQSAIGNGMTHPLPRGGTDFIPL
jgi:hypothetical protein